MLSIIPEKIKSVFLFIQDQEKQRSIDKKKEEVEKKGFDRKKEEVDEVQKLHVKVKQEQQRWDKTCLVRDKHQVRLMLKFSLICLQIPVSFCHHSKLAELLVNILELRRSWPPSDEGDTEEEEKMF